MHKKGFLAFSNLSTWLVLSLILLIVLATIGTGLPAIFIIRDQQDRQAHIIIDQGITTTQTIYGTKEEILANVAILIAQRPTLHRYLLEDVEEREFSAYLEIIRIGANLDLLLVCDLRDQPHMAVGDIPQENICPIPSSQRYYANTSSNPTSAWLVSTHLIQTDNGPLGRVIIGLALGEAFVRNLQQRTGLEQMLVVASQPLISSQQQDAASWMEAAWQAMLAGEAQFSVADHPYYFATFSLSDDIQNLVAYSALESEAARRQLNQSIIFNLAIVILLGSGVGFLLARFIGKPLADLRDGAIALKQGDLATPVTVNTRLPEISLVASAMDDARVALRYNMQELNLEKEWSDALLESIVEGILTLDRKGRITFFSPGAERISGWSQDKALGRHCDEVFEILDENLSLSEWVEFPDRRQKVHLKLPDGKQITVAVTGAKLPPPSGRSMVVLVLRDISDEEALHDLLVNFLTNITHEFRTPLSALAISIELLLDQLPDLSQEELEELLHSHHLGVINLQTLIDNLLEGASIEAGRFQVYPADSDLADIINESAHTMHPILDKYRRHLEIEMPYDLPPVKADHRRTVQVLVNLISNAVKYSPEESQIMISACDEGQYVRVQVADEGPGIQPDEEAEIFQRFKMRASYAEKAQYGIGLGLMVVKAIVEAQGGQVGVEQRPNGGSEFWFTVPKIAQKEIEG
jgi:PAS domain S-box-containing protein